MICKLEPRMAFIYNITRKVGAAYERIQLEQELSYQITMNYLKQMLEKSLITKDEYLKINDELMAKYNLKISTLFFEIT